MSLLHEREVTSTRGSIMARSATILIALPFLLLPLLIGCVERKYSIDSDPSGATLFVNGKRAGQTPYSTNFDYYGDRRLRLEKDGYKIKTDVISLDTPAYLYFPLNLFFEVLFPLTILDSTHKSYRLEPAPKEKTDRVEKRARTFRKEAKKELNNND